jgi:DNA topoisomerase-1
MYSLIISEKPSTARRIAYSLAEGKPKVVRKRGAYWFEFERKGEKFKVVPAVGHLFVLTELNSNLQWKYPVFDTKWAPVFKANRNALYARKYYENIKELAGNAKSFYNAADFDIEGEVIFFNILRFICGKKDAYRMKFSTLTKWELEESFENPSSHLHFSMLEAGLTRHSLDFLWGINLSRALTLSLERSGFYRTLSTGRVQGPTLKILEDRESEIRTFIPKPFWELILEGFINGEKIEAIHEEEKFWDKEKAEEILNKCKNKPAFVERVERSEYKQMPLCPFDLTTLQREAYKNFGYSPKLTLDIAQSLYERALVSYPRTSSQKLPQRLGLKRIIKNLSKQKEYSDLCGILLKKEKLIPREGKKVDPAHPSIYPTGNKPEKLNTYERRVYDMIIRRFLSVFADPAVREQIRVVFDVNGEKFKAFGVRTLKRGWMDFYGKYARFKEQILPKMKEGEILENSNVNMLEKKTAPPKRYTQASILKVMEELGLGTKATRSQVLQTLYERGYIMEGSIVVTALGSAVVNSLKKYCPEIISEELTRKFEEDMELIQQGKKKREEVIKNAQSELIKILRTFKENEELIGNELLEGIKKFEELSNYVGVCEKCGGNLKITFSRASGKKFVGCSNYPKCSQSFPLPQKGKITVTKEKCPNCGLFFISIKGFKRKPWKLCVHCGFKNTLKTSKKS